MKSRINVYVPALLVLVSALVGGCGGSVEEPPDNRQPGASFDAPDAPTQVVVTPGDGQVTVSWTVPAFNGGKDITGYTVRALEGGTVRGDAKVSGATTSATVGGLTNGVAYTVTVTAENVVGTRESAPSVAVVPRKALGRPRDIRATPGNQQVTLNWTAPEDTGLALSAYTVTVRSGETVVTTQQTSDNLLTLTGLTNGTPYGFIVQASNGDGQGLAAEAVMATPRTVPSAPVLAGLSPSDRRIIVYIIASESDGGSPITSYRVNLRGVSGEGNLTFEAPPTSEREFQVEATGLRNGVEYEVTVTAINEAGASTSEAVTTSATTTPGPPRDFRAQIVDGRLTLTWEFPEDNGGRDVSGCRLTKNNPDGSFDMGRTTTLSMTPRADTTYTFTLRCYNLVGDGEVVTLEVSS
ncbi:fibronectin type III domain-containing protein [Pyxidicoccus trucidator]|uniref:fibronectin type III domain-containing protein n=1 Tax=Pyxidicoccus trucidator TaxID=2709662 RepID=UPI0013DA0578|nr:fibronectin type III domain-containing protein [Pyxidicoccus trucidator]